MAETKTNVNEALRDLYDSKDIRRLKRLMHDFVLAVKAPLIGTTFKELKKHERRVEYHYRLSERNRLHPKRKPKGGR